FRYEYDAADRVLAVHYPNGETVQYEYDAGKLVHIPGWVENINYALLDQLQRLSLANGIVHEYEYNPVSFRVDAMTVRASQGGEPLVRLAYEYDRIGNPLRITDRNSRREAYSYDSFGRLVGVSGDIFNETFAYDSAGNCLQNDGFRSGQLAVAPGTNRILGSAGSSTPQFDYELGGEIRRSPGRTFRFDARGRLVLASTDAGMHCEFTYTYDGRVGRTRRTGGKVIETLCLQPDYEIRDGEPTIHISINGQRIGRLSAGQRTYLHPDYRGAIVAVTNQAGEIVAVTNYRPFGAVATTSGSAENASFLGIDIEQVVGVVQLGARWYDPVLGRFISPDQLVLFEPERVLNTPQALNLYVYALNNPMVMTDSTGRLPEWAHWLIGGIILLALTVATVGVGAAAGVAVGAAAGALEAATNILFAASVGSGLGGLYGIASAKLRGGDTAKGFLAGTVVGAIAGALGATDVFLELPIAGAIYNSEIIVYSVAFGATQGATAGLIDRDYGGGGFRGALDAVANVLVGMLIGSATGATGGLLLTVATMSSDILIPIVGVQVVTALATYPTEYVLSDRLLERQRQGDDFRSSSRAERLLPETTASAASGTEAGGGTSYAGRRVDRAIQEALGVS
ncbi:MAG TPA: RHS repeat-associated core domain-containing protein, partial [Terrimicrobiaceae bacterium]|nr:RHS repeat-associated core domain-containing protein [Terrimicrobiaceae bacterium]